MGYVVLAAIVAELASIAIVSDLVGWLWTMAALAGAVVLGMSVISGRGVAVMGRARSAMQAGEPVGAVVADGALVALAGVLLVIPGFVTDVVALALLVPPLRALVRKRASRWFESKMVVVGGPRMGAFARGEGDPRDGFIDVEGTETRGEGDGERGSRSRPELP
ncbi:MAG TPA: FxsA family protein [Kofleriaceae bacterium]|nr:FxsA family protein [Kofleriaceae bacterium]